MSKRVVAEAFIGGGKLRWMPVPAGYVTPFDAYNTRAMVVSSPRALMELARILEAKEKTDV